LGPAICLLATFGTSTRKTKLLLLYNIIVIALFITVLAMNGFPRSKATILERITHFCVVERDYPVSSETFKKKDSKTDLIFWTTYVGSIILLLIVWAVLPKFFKNKIIRAYTAIRNAVVGAFVAFCNFLRVKPKRCLLSIGISLVSTCWIPLCVFFLRILQTQRQDLQRAAGAAYQDSAWGFGQVLAILLWAPLLHGAAFETYGKSQILLSIN
jgi:hypothetical protein